MVAGSKKVNAQEEMDSCTAPLRWFHNKTLIITN